MRNEMLRKQSLRNKRSMRVRKTLKGNQQKPRLSVYKSNKHILVQFIDDEKGVTLGGKSTCSTDFQGTEFSKKNKSSARKLGQWAAEFAHSLNIKEVVFDRGPFKYHGILAELANAARDGGLQF